MPVSASGGPGEASWVADPGRVWGLTIDGSGMVKNRVEVQGAGFRLGFGIRVES